MDSSKRVYHQIPFRCLAANTSSQCTYYGSYRDWLEIHGKAKFGLVHVKTASARDRMDYTKTPISFDPFRLHLALIERVPYFSLIPCPLFNIDIQPVPDEPLKCIPSFEWQERIRGSQSMVKQTFSWAWGILNLCTTEILPSHSGILGVVGYGASEAVDSLLSQQMIVESEEFHGETIREVEHCILELRALVRFATLTVLDACTILGGAEMPVWPLQETAIGTIFDEAKNGHPSLLGPAAKAFALTLEWWGMPHWRIKLGSHRWSIALTIPPLPFTEAETKLQQELDVCVKRGKFRMSIHYILTEKMEDQHLQPAPFLKLSIMTECLILERCASMLGAAAEPSSRFEDFSSLMRSLLAGIWTGAWYEDTLHHGDRFEVDLWKNMSGPFPIGQHTPLSHGFVRVPGPYFKPDNRLLTAQQTVPFSGLSHQSPASSSAARPADSDIWYSLSIRLVGTAASLLQCMDDLQ